MNTVFFLFFYKGYRFYSFPTAAHSMDYTTSIPPLLPWFHLLMAGPLTPTIHQIDLSQKEHL